MVKHRSKGVHPGLISLPVHLIFRQHRAVRRQDPPPDHPVGKAVQTGVIRIIDHILALHLEKIAHISGKP